MPGEDGFSLIAEVRALAPERGGRVPPAAVSVLASDEDRRRALAAWFQMHLPKPVDPDRLARAIADLASSGRR
jgi:CheY-like chemotaxis protein